MDLYRLVATLLGWLPSPTKRVKQQSKLLHHSKMQAIASKGTLEDVFSLNDILQEHCILLPGHLLRTLVKSEILLDVVSLFDKEDGVHFLAIQTGLIYGLKRQNALPEGAAVTANLNVNFRKPMPAMSSVLCTAKIQKIESRKVFVETSIEALDSGERFVDATALFILLPPQQGAKTV